MLLTGSESMLGSYVREVMSDWDIIATPDGLEFAKNPLPREAEGREFELVVHAAESREESEAVEVNLNGTKRLLSALDSKPPKAFVYISDCSVYGRDEGESIDEEHPLAASSKYSQSKILAEKEVSNWCAARGVILTILRPAPMFGSGVEGEMAELFDEVNSGRYIHLRGNNAKRSIVTAYDVARAVNSLWHKGGIFNVADGCSPRFLDLAEAMSANAGARKRMWHLPRKWAAVLGKVPGLGGKGALLDSERFSKREKTLTFSNSRLCKAIDWEPFDTLAVIARDDRTYPYREQ